MRAVGALLLVPGLVQARQRKARRTNATTGHARDHRVILLAAPTLAELEALTEVRRR